MTLDVGIGGVKLTKWTKLGPQRIKLTTLGTGRLPVPKGP